MPGTLFFVHGTGVRRSGYERTLEEIRKGCAGQPKLRDVKVADNCAWGAELGTDARLVELTLPPAQRTRAVTPTLTTAELELALWGILLDDPLFELRVAAQQPPTQAPAIGRQPPDVLVAEALTRLAANPPDVTGLERDRLSAAARTLAATPELPAAALAAGNADDPELVGIVARAVVATALSPAAGDEDSRPPAALDADLRDAAVAAVAKAVAPTTRGLRSWVKDKVADTVKGIATHSILERRAGMTGDSLPKVGDIFFHLRRGSTFLEFLAERMQPWPQPIVAVGHSLGGIMLVDLLSRPDHPPVAKLVTVGSQAPLFYAVDSLEGLRPGQATPQPFTPWLNIYDRSDILSYLAGEVFGANSGIRDEEVHAGVPFPDAHSAYWQQARTYELIANFWP